MSSIVSEHYQFVIGVDTHATTQTFALVAAATGAVLDPQWSRRIRWACPERTGGWPGGSAISARWWSSRLPRWRPVTDAAPVRATISMPSGSLGQSSGCP
ncbi:MAG: hypothetical protein ACXVXP_14320 [Mycobacteriaceae bacterium]